MIRFTSSALLLVSVCVCVGCGSSSGAKNDPPPPAATVNDTATNGPIVYAKSRLEDDHLIVDVIARGPTDIHGVAFRMHWDTAKLSFVEASGSDAWSRQALRLAKEGVPGELVVAWTEKGQNSESRATIDARDDTRLGTLTFARSQNRPGADPGGATSAEASGAGVVTFRTERSMLLDSKGVRIDVAWKNEPPPPM